jgi:predicted kinase
MSLSDNQDEEKRPYDKRSHDLRIADLKSAYIELSAIARITGKKTDASAAKVLKKADVNKSFFDKKKITKDAASKQRYLDVSDEIRDFQKEFNELPHEDTILGKAEARKEKEKNRAIKTEKELVSSREQVAGLYQKIAKLQNRSKDKDHGLIELSHQALLANKQNTSNTVNFASVALVSPDLYLEKNGRYCFDDEALRSEAWARSEKDLHEALCRELPMRVYMLIGPGCAGKSYWLNNTKSYWNDRHPVVIDATNLSTFQRMKWFNIINQYIRTNDIHICGVIFLTPLDTLFERNNLRIQGKKMSDQVIKDKFNALEWPDLKEEKFNEIVVVRHG